MNIDDLISSLDARVGVNGEGEDRYCDCDELIICGARVPVPPGHDCEYVRQRTLLVAEAERIAYQVSDLPRPFRTDQFWLPVLQSLCYREASQRSIARSR